MIKLSRCQIDEQELNAMHAVFEDGYLGMGKQVFEFEQALKAYLKTDRQVVCVNSGTAALHLVVSCLDLKAGDEVLVPTLTFAASFQAISATGAKPIPCDIKPKNLAIDLTSAARYLTPNTKAIMPVHYASHVDCHAETYAFAAAHGLRVIEDAAHAFGTVHDGALVGTVGDIVCFSFDGIKNITCGEGGAIVTQDELLAERLRDARLLGIEKDSLKRQAGTRSWEFDVKHQGYRYHMSNIMAAIGRTQLQKIERFKERRQLLLQRYVAALQDVPSLQLLDLDYTNIMPHIFVVRVKDKKRDGLKDYLQANQVETGVHYKPNHLLSFYKTPYALKNAEEAYQEILTLPLHVGITDDDQTKVIDLIINYLGRLSVETKISQVGT